MVQEEQDMVVPTGESCYDLGKLGIHSGVCITG